jgi:hypothetical protein
MCKFRFNDNNDNDNVKHKLYDDNANNKVDIDSNKNLFTFFSKHKNTKRNNRRNNSKKLQNSFKSIEYFQFNNVTLFKLTNDGCQFLKTTNLQIFVLIRKSII